MVPWRQEEGAEERLRALFRRVVELDKGAGPVTKQQLVERIRAVRSRSLFRQLQPSSSCSAQDEELLEAMHIPTDGEVVEVVQVDIPTDDVLVAAALRSLGGAADDPIDEVRLFLSSNCGNAADG